MSYPVINILELVPDIKPGTRGLYHISSKVTQRLTFFERKSLNILLEKAAEEAGVTLMNRIQNKVMMIGWTPK